MLSPDALLNALITLFVTIDPIGNAPIFIGLTLGMSGAERRSVAVRATLISTGILSLFALTGTGILDAMGITIHAFRVAGGLLLFYTAFEMIYAKRQERRVETSRSAMNEHIANIAVFPLAIPLIAGPGAMSATILLSSQMPDGHLGTASLIGIIAVLMLGTLAILLAAERFDRYLGNTGRMILTRLLGVLLAALSIQYVADGVRALAVS